MLVTGSGATLESAGARLHLKGNAPELVGVASVSVDGNGAATFTAHATASPNGSSDSGYLPIFYQWRLNQVPIAGASGQCPTDGGNGWLAQLTVPDPHCTDTGDYSVVFWNQYGEVLSSAATLPLCLVYVGQVTLVASAGAGWAYNWYFNASSRTGPWGSPIATGPSHLVSYSTSSASRDGFYRVVATLAGQPEQTATVQVSWSPAGRLNMVVVQAIGLGLGASFTAEGPANATFQWFDENNNLLTTQPEFTIQNIACASVGTYRVEMGNCGAQSVAPTYVNLSVTYPDFVALEKVLLAASPEAGWDHHWYFNASSGTGPWGNPVGANSEYAVIYAGPPSTPDGYYRVLATKSGQPDRSAVVRVYWDSDQPNSLHTILVNANNITVGATFTQSVLGPWPAYEWMDISWNPLPNGGEAEYSVPDLSEPSVNILVAVPAVCDELLVLGYVNINQ